tara:strand:+ start:98 stop:769 length:672 start_codon:yes stop_codon:yes gene_type:complete
MKENKKPLQKENSSQNDELIFNGIYGQYTINIQDKVEVRNYRISLLICAISMCLGIFNWFIIGESSSIIWLFTLCIGLSLALHWIHIYIKEIHQILKFFLIAGVIGLIIIIGKFGINHALAVVLKQPSWTLALSPIFITLTGIGFKEFFCFRRPEAFGLTILLPIAILGHITNLINSNAVLTLISLSSILLLFLAVRKFGLDPALDIGDKSVFEYIAQQRDNS